MYIIIAIVIFGVLITVHELGHFTAAKLCGVKVLEFSVGMGPAIIKKQKGETLYSLRALPIGGFCAMEEDEESDDPRSFVNKEWWKRFIILVAGAAANVLVGFLVLLFLVQGSSLSVKPVVTGFFDNCPYESAEGFQVGDEFYKIDGYRIYFQKDFRYAVETGSGVYDIELIRNGERIMLDDFELVPVEYTVDDESILKYGLYFEEKYEGVFGTISAAGKGALDFVRMVWMGLEGIVTGQVGLSDLSGPVGIVGVISDMGEEAETAADAAFGISYLGAFIAVNLGVMNLLPIPALDGGRILFLIVTTIFEKITKRRLNPKYEGYIHAAGMVLLLALMAVVMFSDIYKLFK